MKQSRFNLFIMTLFLMACSGGSGDDQGRITPPDPPVTDSTTGGEGEGDSTPSTPESDYIPISFMPRLQGMTRAEYKDDLSNLTAFSVSALTDSESPSVYFESAAVSRISDGTWKSGETHFWPETPLTFYAYAPADLPLSVTGRAQLFGGYTVGAKTTEHIDIITAWGHGERPASAEENQPVELTFRHALAKVEVRANNTSDMRVDILGVKICRLPSTGTLTFQNKADGIVNWAVNPGSEKDFVIKGDRTATGALGPVTLQNTSATRTLMFGQDAWMFLPQKLTPWTGGVAADGAYIGALVQIRDAAGRLLYPDEEGKYGFTAVPLSATWEAGHSYIYTLNFFANGGGAGMVAPDCYNPEDHGDPDVDVNPGGNRQGGDMVVNSPLSFTVEVTDWVVGSSFNQDIKY